MGFLRSAFRLRWQAAFVSQQIVTLAFGAKHIPFGMLFIANDFGVPVIYIGWACRVRGAWSAVPGCEIPILVRASERIRCAAMVPASVGASDDRLTSRGLRLTAGLQAEAGVSFPSKLLLMPLAISIAFAIIHYRRWRFNLQPPKGLS